MASPTEFPVAKRQKHDDPALDEPPYAPPPAELALSEALPSGTDSISIKADSELATDACAPGSSSEQEAAVQLIVCIKRRLMSLKPCQDSYGRPESDAPQEGTHAAAVNDDFENDRPASTAVLRALRVPMHDSQCTRGSQRLHGRRPLCTVTAAAAALFLAVFTVTQRSEDQAIRR